MVRYGDQEQSSPGGARHPLEASQTPVAPTPAEPARQEGASAPDRQQGREARLAEQDGTRQVPHQRQAPSRRAPLLRRPESLRAIPPLARFLTRASPEPGDPRVTQDPVGQDPVGADPVGQGPVGQDPEEGWPGEAGQGAEADLEEGWPGGAGQGAENDWEGWASQGIEEVRGAAAPAAAPESSAAELRELAELSDLLRELAGLVHDLGALIVGLVTAATGAGDRQARTFAIPPELAELAAAHQELKAGQQALNVRFEAAGSQRERAALRASLAAQTERATRAVSAAAAAVTPQEAQSSGRPSEGATPWGEPRPQSREP